MKRIYGIVIAVAIAFVATFSFNVYAKGSTKDVRVNNEYVIIDMNGYNTRYVLECTNISDSDLMAGAVFYARDDEGNVVKKVSDCGYMVKSGASFILYGQFKTVEVSGISNFDYDITAEKTSECRADAVGVECNSSEEGSLVVSGTNYSSSDVEGINVRSVFYKDGEPVAFDTVNIADTGYTLHSGSSNTQELAMQDFEYDDYVVTWSVSDAD